VHLLRIIKLLTCIIATALFPTSVDVGIKLTDLPSNPQTVCVSQQIKSALLACKLHGHSPACCTGLDAVFADASSHSAG